MKVYVVEYWDEADCDYQEIFADKEDARQEAEFLVGKHNLNNFPIESSQGKGVDIATWKIGKKQFITMEEKQVR